MESQWSFSASALVLSDFVYYSTASIGHSRFTNPDSSSLSPKRSLPLATPTFDAMIQLRYPVPDTDNTYALLDPVPSVCKPVVKRTFQVDLKEELKGHRSHSGIRVHRAEARYDTAFWNEATQSAVLSQESDVMRKVAAGEEAGDDIRKEAEIYDQLRMHQGSIVPTIQGFFCGTIDNVKMSVLVMEPWAPLPFPQPTFDALSVSWRYVSVSILRLLHH